MSVMLVSQVSERLQKFGVKVNVSKCKFFETSVEYLGHLIDKDGVHPTDEKVRAIVEAPDHQDISQLRSHLGLLNYYSKFIPMLSSNLRPLYRLLEKNVECKWSKESKEN